MTAVLFDMDGTLLDSLGDIAAALNEVLGAMGLPQPPLDAYRTMVGYGAAELVRRALPAEQRDTLADEVLARYKVRYAADPISRTKPYEGIEGLLEALEARGIPKAIVTNKPQGASDDMTRRLLGRFSWTKVVGQQDGLPHKPDPAGALLVAQELGIEPSRCFFVGDTDTDMHTATRAGMIGVGCLWGFRDREELERCGARHVIAHPSELLDLVTAR